MARKEPPPPELFSSTMRPAETAIGEATKPAPQSQTIPVSDVVANRDRMITENVAARRDPMPTQGPGSAAGELGDKATRDAFVAGAPLGEDGKAVTPDEPSSTDERQNTPSAAASEPPPDPKPEPPKVEPPAPQIPVSFNPTNASEMYRYVRMLARSSLLPKAFYPKGDYEKQHPKIDDVHFVCLKGQFLGLHPMISIGNINVIDGKAEVGALLMLAMVRKSGLMVPGGWKLLESTDQRAVYATKRIGDDDWTPFEYTIEEARQMGLLDKGKDEAARAKNNWLLQPRTMLRRRGISGLLREIYPDVVIGLYDHGELQEMREREMALGVDPDRVIPMNGIGAAPPAELPEGAAPGPIDRLVSATRAAADPLKDRLMARVNARAGSVRCKQCEGDIDERDPEGRASGLCLGCRP